MQGPALGLPPGHPTSGIAGVIGSIFDPFDMIGTARELASEVIHAPVAIVHEAGNAVTSVANEAGGAVVGVAGSVEKTASSFLSSPVVLIGGAALLLILLSR